MKRKLSQYALWNTRRFAQGGIAMPFPQICAVTQVRQLLPDTYCLTFLTEGIASKAQPGQFVHIACGEGNLLRRPISVCDVSGDEMTVVFEVKGSGTKWLSGRKTGDALDVLGPLGRGFDTAGDSILVVGGGIGVPPMLYTAKRCSGRVTAVLGFRSASRMILMDAFADVCDRVFTVTDDASNGAPGPVTVPMERLFMQERFDGVLCCGPRPMLKAAAELCARFGIPCQVSMEQRMGCGVGACLVCSCQTKRDGQVHMSRVCRDGPVFRAEEVVW